MWRPEGWGEITDKIIDSNQNLFLCGCGQEVEGIELGADAMLEALKKQGVTLTIADLKIDVPGFIIVLIPEASDATK